jgi:hypothetical protein
VDGLDDAAFIEEVRGRNLRIADIVQILPYHPVGRSSLFFEFLASTLKPSQNDIYIYLRQVDMSAFLGPFLKYAKETGFPSSMLAWLIKEKNLIENKGFFDLFLSSNPSPSDFCWVFGEFPALKTREFLAEFLRSKPNQYHIDYMVNTLKVQADWLQDHDELDKVLSFVFSLDTQYSAGEMVNTANVEVDLLQDQGEVDKVFQFVASLDG